MGKAEAPTVSVIIPTYNRAHLVGRAIQSALNQTYENLEILVVDDGSADNTEEIVRGFNDSRVHYIRHSENRGGAAARNTGIKIAHGDYIAFLDSDDEWLPEKLQHQLDIFRKADSEVGLVYSAFVSIYPDQETQRHEETAGETTVGFMSRWLVKKEVLEHIGGLDEDMPALQDTEISIRIQQEYAVLYDPSVVVRYHITPDSICSNVRNIRLATGKLIERYAGAVTRDELADWHFMHGKACVMEGEVGKGKTFMFKAVRLRPLKMGYHASFLASLLGRRGYLWLRVLRRVLLRRTLFHSDGNETFWPDV